MTEPVRKRARLLAFDGVHQQQQQDYELVALQELLLGQCLCSLPEELNEIEWIERRTLPIGVCASWSRDHALLFVSTLQLLCEISYKQLSARSSQCRRLARMCNAVVACNSRLIELLIGDELCGGCDPYVRFASGRALPAVLVTSKQHVDPLWLEQLADAALLTSPLTATFALDVFRRVLEWRDVECHPMEDQPGASTSSNFVTPMNSCQQVTDPEGADSQAAKCACIHALESRWPALVNHFDSLMASYVSANEACITTFITLWEAIISVKANLSVVDTKPFYSHLDGFVVLLGPNLPPLLWKRLLGLFNEVMCYGSTLALQDTIAEEPCSLAHLVVRSVKDWHLLDALPFRTSGGGAFSGRSANEEGDRPLLQKMCLLVLKSVAVTVKETRSDSSSSDASSSSGGGGGGGGGSSEEEAAAAADDMAVIARSIAEVLRRLDACVKQLMPFHPETPLAQWVVQLFSDQDDALVEGMVCCLDVEVGLNLSGGTASSLVSNSLRSALSPTQTFAQFLRTVSHDHEVLLDLLVSNETCFLLYLLRFLKYARRQWADFVAGCNRELDNIITVLIRLRISINRLVTKALFPYNIKPVLRLLEKCEQLYEDGDFH